MNTTTTKPKRTLTAAAQTSKAIKAELKKAYPKTRFSVKSSNFANGNSVDIFWTNGATANKVEEYTAKFQKGSFNGMEDIYENSNSRDDIPQAKFVSTSRRPSEELEQVLNDFKKELMKDARYEDADFQAKEYLNYRVFRKTSIHPAATNFRIERAKNVSAGVLEDLYELKFDTPTI